MTKLIMTTQSSMLLENNIQRSINYKHRYDAPGDIWLKQVKRSDLHRVNEASPRTVTQSWPWGGQIADKKIMRKKYPNGNELDLNSASSRYDNSAITFGFITVL